MRQNRLSKLLIEIQKEIKFTGIDTTNGLPEDLFLFSTTLAPVSNVDLFITNDKGEVLLSWRNDVHYGEGWHIPGGCIRLKERMIDRIQKTALLEIGCNVICDEKPILVKELVVDEERCQLNNNLERCHNISFLFGCAIPKDYIIKNNSTDEHCSGYLKWFDHVPEDLLKAHADIYGDFLVNWFKNRSY